MTETYQVALRDDESFCPRCYRAALRLLEHGGRMERERDEAREALVEWENAAKHVEANHPDEVHCGCVPVLRKLLTDARRERDEAREAFAVVTDQLVQAQSALRRAERERDEAREEIKGWKLKWKCAVEIAALSQNKLEAAK